MFEFFGELQVGCRAQHAGHGTWALGVARADNVLLAAILVSILALSFSQQFIVQSHSKIGHNYVDLNYDVRAIPI